MRKEANFFNITDNTSAKDLNSVFIFYWHIF